MLWPDFGKAELLAALSVYRTHEGPKRQLSLGVVMSNGPAFLTAVVAVPLLILAIQWKEPYGVWIWVLIAQVTGLREWMNMTLPKDPALTRWLRWWPVSRLATCCAGFLPAHLQQFGLFAVTGFGLLYFLFAHGNIETVAADVDVDARVLYAGVLIVPLVMFKTAPSSAVVLSMSVCRARGVLIPARILPDGFGPVHFRPSCGRR